MQDLQQQVDSLMQTTPPPPVSVSVAPPTVMGQSTNTTTTSTTTTTTMPSIFTPPMYTPMPMPSGLVSAAASLNSRMQTAGLAQSYSHGIGLMSPGNPQQINNTVVNPLHGMGESMGTLGRNSNRQVISSVDQIYNCTVISKQLRAHEFAASAQFPYKSQLNQNNCNAVVFAFGSFKHLEAIMSGLIPGVSDTELLARIRHLKNVFEICCLSSNLQNFCDPAWQVAREYDNRVISDIESGAKYWGSLSNGLETDAIYVAKEIVELKNKSKKITPANRDKTDSKSDRPKKEKPGCTTYNTFKGSEGCYWESQNKGESCVFDHFCSWCKTNRNTVEKHKMINCEFKTE